jgi:hypothetical protein
MPTNTKDLYAILKESDDSTLLFLSVTKRLLLSPNSLDFSALFLSV